MFDFYFLFATSPTVIIMIIIKTITKDQALSGVVSEFQSNCT